ncbi:hypothetical protein PoB_003953700 [Plakobranchus ocellatus]|uniref:Uncharacterized protein n=1 Tax=Plakobranchus ocellatus TaxID=259542 RepID=A0AAV4B1B4_9GAST|nr:hypothetical protein PoB_003953700 [Plakobranchus ocellatus]
MTTSLAVCPAQTGWSQVILKEPSPPRSHSLPSCSQTQIFITPANSGVLINFGEDLRRGLLKRDDRLNFKYADDPSLSQIFLLTPTRVPVACIATSNAGDIRLKAEKMTSFKRVWASVAWPSE